MPEPYTQRARGSSRYDGKLDAFAQLPKGWDSYGGKATSPFVVAGVKAFLGAVEQGQAVVVPLSDGGVQIEWHGDGFDVEVTFAPNGDVDGSMERVG